MAITSPAAILAEHGQPLVIDDITFDDPGADQVLVKLFASGICHSQLHQIHSPDTPTPTLIGHEATAIIREREKETGEHIVIIAMTAAAMKGDRERCFESGMDAYISKPIKVRDLALAILHAGEKRGQDYIPREQSSVAG